MNFKTQKLMLERLLSSNDIFAKCAGIISHEYFDADLKPVVKYISNYHEKYSAIPKLDQINAEFDIELSHKNLDNSDIASTCDSIELFCKQSALFNAIAESGPDVAAGKVENFGKVLERVQKALAVSIQKELGIEMFANPEQRLRSMLDTEIYEPTGIVGLDEALGGGLARKQVTMFSANSGGGKSLMLSNIGANYAKSGKHVVQLALELTQEMIYLRNISIITGVSTKMWKESITEISGIIGECTERGAGSFKLARIPGGSNANLIRSYLKQYELETGRKPDVIIVDYLDLMSPNGGNKDKGIFEQDKEKSEQLADIAFDYNAIVLTASQQNRGGVGNEKPDQAVIAGGISKINTVDNYISIYMNPEMRIRGELFLYYLKTRSSTAVGSMTHLAFNPDNLIMSDKKGTTASVLSSILARAKVKENTPMQFPGVQNVSIPNEMMDSILEYHDNQNKDAVSSIVALQEHLVDDRASAPVNLDDDEELWSNKHKIKKIRPSDDMQDLIKFMTVFETP